MLEEGTVRKRPTKRRRFRTHVLDEEIVPQTMKKNKPKKGSFVLTYLDDSIIRKGSRMDTKKATLERKRTTEMNRCCTHVQASPKSLFALTSRSYEKVQTLP
eukprot:TRINITY_DN4266_c0_g1_i7.p3 TRINITY_DN4266_c0_g1~~TRINITY_DN4266_c0_g1_i7.p3  ORF type:complete len:102 (-),score=5.31 TRINITY_DN4266_c0_g1_i7:545-850(-)